MDQCEIETHYGMQLIECVRLWLFHPDWGEKDHISATPRMDEQPTACVKEQTIKDYKAKYKDSVSHMHAFRAKFLRGCRVPRRRRRRSGRARTARSASTRPPQDGPAAVRAARLTGRPFSRAIHTRPAMRISGTPRDRLFACYGPSGRALDRWGNEARHPVSFLPDRAWTAPRTGRRVLTSTPPTTRGVPGLRA